MLFGKWDWDVAKEVWQEEAEERGEARGVEKGVAIGEARAEAKVLDLMAKGYDVNQIKEILKRKKS